MESAHAQAGMQWCFMGWQNRRDSLCAALGRPERRGEAADRIRPPMFDTMLAATAIAHDLCLGTRNLRDLRHRGVTCLTLWERNGNSTWCRGPLRPSPAHSQSR